MSSQNPCGAARRWIAERSPFARAPRLPWLISMRAAVTAHPKCFLVLSLPLLVALGFLLYLAIPTPNVRIVLHASTEVVRFFVANPDQGAFRVAAMRAFAEDSSAGDCVMGVVQPAVGATVKYRLTPSGKPAIELLPPDAAQAAAQYTDETGQTRPLSGPQRILPDESCKGNLPQRFPILGNAEFGNEYSAPTATLDPMLGTLSDARLTFYAKSPRFFLFFQPSIYEWKKLDLPGGSRVGAITGADDGSKPVWRGLAQYEFDKDKATYIVDASITARGVRLTIPGVEDQDSQIVFDKFSPLTGDPNWIALQLYAGAAIWLIPSLLGFWKWLGKRNALRRAKQ